MEHWRRQVIERQVCKLIQTDKAAIWSNKSSYKKHFHKFDKTQEKYTPPIPKTFV